MNEDIVQYLQARVVDLRKRLADLEGQRESLDIEMNEVTELFRATNAVLKAERTKRGLDNVQEASWAAIKSTVRSMTLKEAIRTVVEHHGQEGIHVNKILEWLKDAGFPLRAKDPKASIAGSIHIEIKSEGAYEKVAPNTFKLVERTGVGLESEFVRVERD